MMARATPDGASVTCVAHPESTLPPDPSPTRTAPPRRTPVTSPLAPHRRRPGWAHASILGPCALAGLLLAASRPSPATLGAPLGLPAAAAVAALPAAPVAVTPAAPGEREELFAAGFESIEVDDLLADLGVLAGPRTEGRDSPSAGLELAAAHIAARLSAAGFTGAGEAGSFLLPFTRAVPAPVAARCGLSLTADDQRPFVLGVDFVPVWKADGQAEGELVVLGFGIDSHEEHYDDVSGDLHDTIVLISSGEPRHRKRFEGAEISADAELYTKLATLKDAGVLGVLVVRRPEPTPDAPAGRRGRSPAPAPPEPPPFGFRHTWAQWNGDPNPVHPLDAGLPALEITPEAAAALAGFDVLEPLGTVDAKAKPPKPVVTGRRVRLSAASEVTDTPIANVAGVLAGSDPALADQYVVLGAHYDHVGVDSRGRVGFGADDNGSGTAALLEVAAALALAHPRRSILACAFAAEEDGLLGSDALAEHPPVPIDAMAAMINMDMLGFGEPDEVIVLGVPENPGFEKLLNRARKLRNTKVRDVVTGKGQSLFQRSDHYNFHRRGVPAMFFFEGLPIDRNPHYHTWHDTIDVLDLDKIAASARLVFNTVWLLAEDDERPPPPESTH